MQIAYSKVFAVTNCEDIRKNILKINTERATSIEILDEDELDILPENADFVLIEDSLACEVMRPCRVVCAIARNQDRVLSLIDAGCDRFIFSAKSEIQLLCAMFGKEGWVKQDTIVAGKFTVDVVRRKVFLDGIEVHFTKSMYNFIERVYIDHEKPTTADRVVKCRIRETFGKDAL